MSAARRKWSSWTTTGALFAAALTVMPPIAEAATQSAAGSSADSTRVRPARTVHEILTSEVGVRRPTGLTYDPDRRTLLLTGDLPKGGSEVVAVTPAEKPRGREVRRALDDGVTAAYDPRTDQLRARTAGVGDPAGSTYTPDGTLHVLDAAHHTIVSIAPDGTVGRTSLAELAGRDLRGLAYQPNQRLLYVADTSGANVIAWRSATFASEMSWVRTFFSSSAVGATDNEDVAYDSKRNNCLLYTSPSPRD